MSAIDKHDGQGPNGKNRVTPTPEHQPDPDPEFKPESTSRRVSHRLSAPTFYQNDDEHSSGSEYQPEVNRSQYKSILNVRLRPSTQESSTISAARQSPKRSSVEALTPGSSNQKISEIPRVLDDGQSISTPVVLDANLEDDLIMQMKQPSYSDRDASTHLVTDWHEGEPDTIGSGSIIGAGSLDTHLDVGLSGTYLDAGSSGSYLDVGSAGAGLSGINSSRADSSRADSSRADTSRADTSRADSSRADSSRADTSRANISCTDASGSGLGSLPSGSYEDITDWHEGEDELLDAACIKAEAKQALEIEKIKAEFFTVVAQEINKVAAYPRFSARACKERREAIESGTAGVLPARDEVEEQKPMALSAKDNDKARQNREADAAVRSQHKKINAEFKREKRTIAKEKRQRKSEFETLETNRRKYDSRRAQIEKDLLKRLEHEQKARGRTQPPMPEGAGVIIPQSPPLISAFHANGNKIPSRRNTDIESFRGMDVVSQELALDNILRGLPKVSVRKQKADEAAAQRQKEIASASIMGLNPREWLTMEELWDVMRDRGMNLFRMKESRPIVLARIEDDDNERSHDEMKVFCARAGISTEGTKTELVRRFAEHEARHSKGWQRRYGIKPTWAEAKQAMTTAKANFEAMAAAGRTPSRFTARPEGLGARRYRAQETSDEFREQVEQMKALNRAPGDKLGEFPPSNETHINKSPGNKYLVKRRAARKPLQAPMVDALGAVDYAYNNSPEHYQDHDMDKEWSEIPEEDYRQDGFGYHSQMEERHIGQ